jgi:uncharacterized protein DUF6600/FecR-like protein
MRSTRPVSSTIFFLFLTLFTATIIARADDVADDADEYDVKARVVRISLITGDVNLKRNASTDWERAKLNFSLVEGDTISTGDNARAEIQMDARNFVRIGPNSILKIATLRDEGVALSVVEGTASVRLAKFDRDHEYFEVDAPKSTLAAEKKGLYRIDVSREGRVRLTAQDGGRARIYSDTSGFVLRDGRTAELIYEGADAGDWQFVAANASDSWDNWVENRERYLAQRLRYDARYYDSYVWGAEELDAYGEWTYANDYGWIWRPTAINNYYDWAPYRYGSWTWCAPYGWTWVGHEPWGWAPYHYGRWVYYNNYWAWCPRSRYYRNRSWWRPALVAFNISFGNQVCWYPLHYHQRDPRSRHYHASDRLRPMRRDELAGLRRVNPAYLRAVTSLAARDFGADGARLRAADAVLARRVVAAEPLHADLPIRPAYALNDRAVAGDRTERVTIARPARVTPDRQLPERETGAAVRNPGVALDNELRRSRVLNGRDARPEFPTPASGAGGAIERSTGAVARPSRPAREVDPAVDRRSESGRDVQPIPETAEPNDRPARPNRTFSREDAPARPERNVGERPAPVPVTPPANDGGSSGDSPARPERTERSQPQDAPARVARPERHDRPDVPSRVSEPPPRYEPPPRVDSPPRSDPPPRNDPPPRYDPPPRNDPPPRSDPPPRNDPPPRSDPPPRNDPPPQNDPPPRSESPRNDPAPRNDPPARSESPRSDSDRPAHRVKDPR